MPLHVSPIHATDDLEMGLELGSFLRDFPG